LRVAIPRRTDIRSGGIALKGHTAASTAMGTHRQVATATGITTMGVGGPSGTQEVTAPSREVEGPLMGMAVRPMTDMPPVHQITGCLQDEAIPQAEAMGIAGTAITAEARAVRREADPIAETIDGTDRVVLRAGAQTGATVKGTDPTVTIHGTDRPGETVREADRVVPLVTLRAIRIAPERAPGPIARPVIRPGSEKSRASLTCLHFRRVPRTASRGFGRCMVRLPSLPTIRQLPYHGSGG